MLAMLLASSGATAPNQAMSLLATDVDERALALARQGQYAVSATAEVPVPWRARFFRTQGDTAVVADELRPLVTFARHDLMGPTLAPPEAVVASFHVIVVRTSAVFRSAAAPEDRRTALGAYQARGRAGPGRLRIHSRRVRRQVPSLPGGTGERRRGLRALVSVGYGLCAWVLNDGHADPMWMWGLVALPMTGIAAEWCLRRVAGWPAPGSSRSPGRELLHGGDGDPGDGAGAGAAAAARRQGTAAADRLRALARAASMAACGIRSRRRR